MESMFTNRHYTKRNLSSKKICQIYDNAGVKITAYIGKSPKIIIPAEIEGLPVLEVEALAYVKLPAGIKEWEDKDDPDLYHIAF